MNTHNHSSGGGADRGDRLKRAGRGGGDERVGRDGRDGFVWPPRESVVASERRAEQAGVSASTADQSLTDGSLARTAPIARGTSLGLSWWGQVERVWLDVVAPPLRERAADEGWAPDEPDDYCWRCGVTIDERNPSEEFGCAMCAHSRPAWERMVRLGRYEPPLSRWVQEVKFTRWRRLGVDLGRMLGERVAVELERLGPVREAEREVIVVPMPMSRRRRWMRGIDHTRAISEGVVEMTGGRIVEALSRKHRPSQLAVPTSKRQENVRGAFSFRAGVMGAARAESGLAVPERVVVVVDDVSTTGATMQAACRAIRESLRVQESAPGASTGSVRVWGAVVAMTPDHLDDRLSG